MTIRTRFKVDSIDLNHRHVDYERDENGFPQKTKPTLEKSATVAMSPVDPGADKDKVHENSKIWKGRPAGRVMFNTVDEAAIAELSIGKEYFIDITPVPAE